MRLKKCVPTEVLVKAFKKHPKMVRKTEKMQAVFLDIRSSNAYKIDEKSTFGPALKVNILTPQKKHEMRSWTPKMRKKRVLGALKNEALGCRKEVRNQ